MAYQGERTFSEVFQDIVGNVQSMIRSELLLAKTEVKEEASKGVKAARVLAIGALLAIYAVGLLLLTVVRALETTMEPWQATLSVAALVGLVSLVVINAGRSRMKNVHPVPEKTMHAIQEDVQWMKDQIK